MLPLLTPWPLLTTNHMSSQSPNPCTEAVLLACPTPFPALWVMDFTLYAASTGVIRRLHYHRN